MNTQRNLLIAFMVMAVITSGAASLFILRSKDAKVASRVVQVPVHNIIETPVPTQGIVEAQIQVQKIAEAETKDRVVTSSDGLKSLTMKIKHGTNNSATYSFYIQDTSLPIFTKTVGVGVSMDIPDNAWAPGENYIFLEQTANGIKDYYVLKPTGEAFADGQQAVSVVSLFAAKYTDYKFSGATGWADPSLLIVESTNSDGSTGPSFWFEMPEGSFIQLSQHQ